MKHGRRATNELEFQGQVVGWIDEEIHRRQGLQLDKATQEKPRTASGKRNDLVVWKNRAAEVAFLAMELKTPSTPINDATLFADAVEKAQHWQAPYFAIWNMRAAELYKTPQRGNTVTPADAIKRWPPLATVTKLEDWLRPDVCKQLRSLSLEILQASWDHAAGGDQAGQLIDAEIFVARLRDALAQLRAILYDTVKAGAAKNAKLRRTINRIAAEQGFRGFVEDTEFAIAGQMCYRLAGQILFYFALRRKQPSLRPLVLQPDEEVPAALRPYWSDVRRFDYEALFKPDQMEELVAIPFEGQQAVRALIAHFSHYEWASLTNDVLGAVFQALIPHAEQILLGQFYTPRPVADLLVALAADGERPRFLDPGCGSGTILMGAYDYLAHHSGLTHKDILPLVWGFDLSPFSAELAAINLFRRDLAEFDNFPRIVPGNFFDRQPGQTVEFPPARATPHSTAKVPVPIPDFDCIVGNPPYLRSQNQDDLDPSYRDQLFRAAAAVGIKAQPKTDLFAFFIYHAMRFMRAGSRLGFVTPASWLTADYAAALQRLLLSDLRLVAVVSSGAESFFPQVDVNAVLLVAERVEGRQDASCATLRFVNLKLRIAKLTEGGGWQSVTALADLILGQETSMEDERLRVTLIPLKPEKDALLGDPATPRNWSKFVRAPLSYYTLFGGAA